MNNRHLYLLAAVLAAAGLAVFFYKLFYLDFPLTEHVTLRSWEVEIKITFQTYGRPARVELQVPGSRTQLPILNENFISRGFGLTTTHLDNHRVAIWSKRRPTGPQALYYRAMVEVRPHAPVTAANTPPLHASTLTGASLLAGNALLDEARQRSTDLDSLVAQLVSRLQESRHDEYSTLLLAGHTSEKNRLDLMVQLLALAEFPARTIHGISLRDPRGRTVLRHWLEVYDRDGWHIYDAATGLPEPRNDHLEFWRGPGRLVRVSGGDNVDVDISREPVPVQSLAAAASRERLLSPGLSFFSLSSLPLATQNVYRVLLLVPLGAFVIVLMRSLVGLVTFGTFMPVLIALAFRETHLLAGLVLFTVLVALGLLVRFYLDRLKLLLVPRLAAILTVVIMLMLCVSIIANRLDIESGLSVALFPMVIITMTIERMSIVWEERGPREAIQQGLGSLAAATLAYASMNWTVTMHLFTVFPELLFVLLAATILLGRYSGYRLLELKRFRALLEKDK